MMALYHCDACGTVTMTDMDKVEKDDGIVLPLGFCGIVRETHNSDNDVCTGTVVYRGTVELIDPQAAESTTTGDPS